MHEEVKFFGEPDHRHFLKQIESGTIIPKMYRGQGMSSVQFYKWCSQYGGMIASTMARLKELEEENWRLKKMYTEMSKKGLRPKSWPRQCPKMVASQQHREMGCAQDRKKL